jgi:urease accessory protein
MDRIVGLALAALVTLVLIPAPALAHTGLDDLGGFASGFVHPIVGFDHLLAMLAVGIWGAQLGAPAIWMLPVAFPLIMAMGGLLGVVGVPLVGTEPLIALSVVVLGAMIAWAARPMLPIAIAVVSVFALFHGHAHGVEMPEAVSPVAYGLGFVLATGMIHGLGIAIGSVISLPWGPRALRGAGTAISLVGVVLLIGLVFE